jgi:hypothetical protein
VEIVIMRVSLLVRLCAGVANRDVAPGDAAKHGLRKRAAGLRELR